MRVIHARIDAHYDASGQYIVSLMYQFDAEVPTYRHAVNLPGVSGNSTRESAAFDFLLQLINQAPPIQAP